jgi:2'-5' RNA ligase
MLQKDNLYFVAIIPSREICDEITRFKQAFADRFFCKAALKLIPHVTLKAPFKLAPSQHEQLLQWFRKLPVPIQAFDFGIRDFAVFPKRSSPVIFLQVVLNEYLQALQTSIINSFRAGFPHIALSETEMNFHPHITIAYRDLDPILFKEAWEEYKKKKYRAIIEVNDFHLLQHDEIQWIVIASYALSPEATSLPI